MLSSFAAAAHSAVFPFFVNPSKKVNTIAVSLLLLPGLISYYTHPQDVPIPAQIQPQAELETALNAALGNVERSFAKKLEDARKIAGIARKQLPRVMVIGVMGEVAFQTESEYGEMLDLRFYKQEENLSLIRAQVKHCDYVVLIVGHINHGHQDCVRNHPGLIFCNGGVTQMKEILLNLACK